MEKSVLKTLGGNIRKTRQLQGLSQEVLAEKASLHRTYIGGIERGERNVSFINLVQIARALKISLSELLENIN